MKIILSFDDGHISDIRAARLMRQYGFTGTFYIPNKSILGNMIMSLKEIREEIIVKYGHNVGGHTVSHPMDMKLLSDEDLEFEIINNRAMIEQNLMKGRTYTFCYPRGRHDQRVRDMVKKCGYEEARTTEVLCIKNSSGDSFQTPTTIHMFQRNEYEGIHWPVMARLWFLKALEASQTDDKAFFSLWGHSKELDAQNDWEHFEQFLKFMQEKMNSGKSELSTV